MLYFVFNSQEDAENFIDILPVTYGIDIGDGRHVGSSPTLDWIIPKKHPELDIWVVPKMGALSGRSGTTQEFSDFEVWPNVNSVTNVIAKEDGDFLLMEDSNYIALQK